MAAFPRPTALVVGVLACLSACTTTSAPPPSPEPPAPSVTEDPVYDVELTASDDVSTWTGTETIGFGNAGAAPLGAVWLRLWANGNDGCDPRAVTIDVASGGRLAGTKLGCTAVRILLEPALEPGERTGLRLDVTIAVPRANDRFGSFRGLTNMGGALPILAVRDDTGWHLDPYVAIGESFLSVVADYTVRLTTPADLSVATTGMFAGSEPDGDRVTRTVQAEGVRDFMWSYGEIQAADGDAGGVRIRIWYQPGAHVDVIERTMSQAQRAMTSYADAFGAYPYEEVDIVLTRFAAYGGMEYPQLVLANPRRVIVAHELAHQWWWVTVGNDEYAEPWLDESLATWTEELPFRPWARCGGYEWPSPEARITNDMAYWAAHPEEYRTIYAGGGCMLADLADHLGLDQLVGALARYARAHRLGIATAGDLQREIAATAAEVAPGFDLDAFWRHWRVDVAPGVG